jgi:predicted N-acetyltransferase YhbS
MLNGQRVDNLSISTGHAGDVDKIWSIICSSFRGPHSQYIATGQPGYRFYLEEMLRDKNENHRRIIVAKENDQVAAFADVTVNSSTPNFLNRIAVGVPFRGRGLATRLMREIQRDIDAHPEWELDVLHSNAGAHQMYRRLGFRTTSTKKWTGRLIANNLTRPKTTSNRSVADQAYERYGFTQVDFQGRFASVAGTAARCHIPEDFSDNNFLAQVQDRFPRVDRAFIISDARETRLSNLPETFEIARSDRMIGTF